MCCCHQEVSKSSCFPHPCRGTTWTGAGRAGHTPMQISCRGGVHFPEQDPGVCGIRRPEDTRTTEFWFLEDCLALASNKA